MGNSEKGVGVYDKNLNVIITYMAFETEKLMEITKEVRTGRREISKEGIWNHFSL